MAARVLEHSCVPWHKEERNSGDWATADLYLYLYLYLYRCH
jgi:hypothetical protein